MITSGCANSLEDEGTSFPRNGTASLSRVLGMSGSFSKAFSQSFLFNNPNETRLIFFMQCGKNVKSQSWVRFNNFLHLKETLAMTVAESLTRSRCSILPSGQTCRYRMFLSHHLHHQSKQELLPWIQQAIYR